MCYPVSAGDRAIMTNKGRPLTANEASRPVTTEPKATVEEWHDEQTRQAVAEADAGDFAPAEEVKAIVRKYVPHG
jgi:predicted transcriptional regulator